MTTKITSFLIALAFAMPILGTAAAPAQAAAPRRPAHVVHHRAVHHVAVHHRAVHHRTHRAHPVVH